MTGAPNGEREVLKLQTRGLWWLLGILVPVVIGWSFWVSAAASAGNADRAASQVRQETLSMTLSQMQAQLAKLSADVAYLRERAAAEQRAAAPNLP